MKWLIKVMMWLLNLCLWPFTNWAIEVENNAPKCCGEKTEFKGHYIGLFQETFFYQCGVCWAMFAVSPLQRPSLKHLWRVIFQQNTKVA